MCDELQFPPLEFSRKKLTGKTILPKNNMNVIPLMCIETLVALGLAEGRLIFLTFFEHLSSLRLHAFLPCFLWFLKNSFFPF